MSCRAAFALKCLVQNCSVSSKTSRAAGIQMRKAVGRKQQCRLKTNKNKVDTVGRFIKEEVILKAKKCRNSWNVDLYGALDMTEKNLSVLWAQISIWGHNLVLCGILWAHIGIYCALTGLKNDACQNCGQKIDFSVHKIAFCCHTLVLCVYK